jgi:NTP pyrophosphatase (non-canonical NTP hydrolase)
MKFEQYLIESARTHQSEGKRRDLLHCASGMVTEAGELIDPFKRAMFYKKELDVVNVIEEVGDGLWYIAIACRIFNLNLDLSLENNRYYKSNKIKQIQTEEGLMEFMLNFNEYVNKLTMKIVRVSELNESKFDIDCFTDVIQEMNLIGEIFNFNLELAMEVNINKLKKRFPNKFNCEDAITRDLKAERELLETELRPTKG